MPLHVMQVIRVSPESGSIRPRESMLCKVVIEAIGKPTYYDVDVVCEVRFLVLTRL